MCRAGSDGERKDGSDRTFTRHLAAVRVVVTSAVPSIHESEGLERRSLSIAVKVNSP
jgi:hypothetical protein